MDGKSSKMIFNRQRQIWINSRVNLDKLRIGQIRVIVLNLNLIESNLLNLN